MNYSLQILFNDINHGCRAASLKKNYLWLLPFYMALTEPFFLAAELNNIESEDEVFAQGFLYE